MARPLIGITTYWVPAAHVGTDRPWGRPEQDMVMSTADYARSVERVGGVPVLLPNVAQPETVADLIARCDALLLTGGADLDPCAYGGAPGLPEHRLVPERDLFEFQLIERALDRDIPILGICRGYQLINVWFGGTLHRDLAEAGIEDRLHCALQNPMETPSHKVLLAEGSALRAAYGTPSVGVNSFHHQGVDRVGAGLVVVGRAEDGQVEAVEHPDHPLLWGVQWHPEMMSAAFPEHLAPFRLLIDRAAGRS